MELFVGFLYLYTAGVHHTPLGRFSMLDISTVGIVSVPKRSALETSRRELAEDVRIVWYFRILLVVEQSSVENAPTGGVRYTCRGR